jgi:oligopeptide transport system substrate-binding protein
MLNRRWRLPLLLGAFIAVLTLVAVACGGDEEEEEASPTAAGEVTEEAGGGEEAAPADQQVLVVQQNEPEFFDPHRSNFEQDISIEKMVFRGLYQLVPSEDGGVEAVPAMAEGEPEVDGNVYTVKLKSGLLWSDGEPLTAQHFADGVLRSCSPEVGSPYQYILGASILGIVGCDEYATALGTEEEPKSPTPEELQALRDAVGVEAVDDTTLQVSLLQPKTTFTIIMSLWSAFPARLDVIEQFGEKWTDPGNIVTNGPYTITEFVPKDHVLLEPNPNWALDPKPAIQKLTIRFIDDTAVAFRAYQTGEIDIVNFPESEIPTVEANPDLKEAYLLEGTGRQDAVEIQLEDPTLSDFNVRLAISRAIDRETLNDVVYNGASIAATYWLVEGVPGYQGNEPFESVIGYDPDAAKQALTDAGYPDGQGFPGLTLVMRDDAVQRSLGEFLQNQWKTVLNINVELEFVDAKTRSDRFNTEDFQLFRGGWQIDYPDPENLLIGLFDTGGGNNHYNCSDPDIDAALAAAATETDNDARIKLLQEAETLVVTKLCGVAPITQLARVYLVNPKVGGLVPNGAIDSGLPGNWGVENWFVKAQ